jgi:hypothetical protein
LNLVERFFAEITQAPAPGNVPQRAGALIAAIRSYVREHNKDPRPFIWTATASATLRKIEVVKNR